MEMTSFEKFFVNRRGKGLSNLRRIRRAIGVIDAGRVHDVLEIGCGMGTVSAALAREHGWSVTGTDYDPAQIELAKQTQVKREGLRFQREDATKLSFPDASFDFVIAQMVFHHIPEWPAALKELARVLRPGGWMAWYDHTVSARTRRRMERLVKRLGLCAQEDVASAFAAAGFEELTRHATQVAFLSFEDVVCCKVGLTRSA